MVNTIKFSEMTAGGDLAPNEKTPGLLSGANVLFNNPFPLLAPGSTLDRPAPDSSMYFRLRFNTTLESYEYYSPTTMDWVQLEDSLNNYVGPFVTFTSAPDITGNFDLGTLTSGILKQTVLAGVSTPAIAVNAVDYWAPGDALTRTQVPAIGDDVTNKTYIDGLDLGNVKSVTGTANEIDVDNTDPQNPILELSSTLVAPGTIAVGNLFFDTNTISSTNINGDLIITPNGTGDLVLDGLNWPQADGTAGYFLQTDGAGQLSWQPAGSGSGTVTAASINEIAFYPANGDTVDGIPTANSAIFRTDASGIPGWSASLTDGQLLIGDTSGTPVAATLTAGPGISISNSAGGITIAGTGSGIGWTEVTGTTQAMVADNGYVANNGALVVFTLPATAAFGTVINLVGKGAGGWRIDQNASQNIRVGSVSSTVGTGGSVASTNRYDSIELLCTTANTTWTVLGGPQGNLTIV